MQALAAWLVARPQNAVLGLAVTLLLPAPQLTSGVIMVLLVLAQGAQRAVLEALAAGSLLVVVSLLFGVSVASIVTLMAGTWVPVVILATLLMRTRSLALTLQVTVIVAVVALAGFYVVVADPVAFWQPTLTAMTTSAPRSPRHNHTSSTRPARRRPRGAPDGGPRRRPGTERRRNASVGRRRVRFPR